MASSISNRQALVSSDAWKAAQQPELCDQSAFVFWSSLVLQRFGFR
jgi:hypothetical protein